MTELGAPTHRRLRIEPAFPSAAVSPPWRHACSYPRHSPSAVLARLRRAAFGGRRHGHAVAHSAAAVTAGAYPRSVRAGRYRLRHRRHPTHPCRQRHRCRRRPGVRARARSDVPDGADASCRLRPIIRDRRPGNACATDRMDADAWFAKARCGGLPDPARRDPRHVGSLRKRGECLDRRARTLQRARISLPWASRRHGSQPTACSGARPWACGYRSTGAPSCRVNRSPVTCRNS